MKYKVVLDRNTNGEYADIQDENEEYSPIIEDIDSILALDIVNFLNERDETIGRQQFRLCDMDSLYGVTDWMLTLPYIEDNGCYDIEVIVIHKKMEDNDV